jgi:hypothetical protein
MAKSWLEKLNTLVRASINDFTAEVGSRIPTPTLRSKDLENEVEALRERVNEALAYEDKLEAQIRQLEDKAVDLDRAADASLLKGDEARARRFLQEMRRVQHQIAIFEADLKQHRRSTAELISNVNYFDSLVGDVSRREASRPAAPPAAETTTAPPPRQARPVPRKAERRPSGLLTDAERRLSRLEAPVAPEAEAKPAEAPAEPAKVAVEAEEPEPPKVQQVEAPPAEPPKTIRVKVVAGDTPPAEAQPEPPKREGYAIPADLAEQRAAEDEAIEAEEAEKPVLPEVERLTKALRKARENAEQAEVKLGYVGEIRARIEDDAAEPLPEITGVYEPAPDEIDAEIAKRRRRLKDEGEEEEVSE